MQEIYDDLCRHCFTGIIGYHDSYECAQVIFTNQVR